MSNTYIPGGLPHHAGAPLEEGRVVRLVNGVHVAPHVLSRSGGHVGGERRADRNVFPVAVLVQGLIRR